MKNSKTGLVLMFGLLGIIGIAIVAFGRRQPTEVSQPDYRQTAVGFPLQRPAEAMAYYVEDIATEPVGRPVFSNKQEWQFVRGPDRLIEKIVVTRELVKYE